MTQKPIDRATPKPRIAPCPKCKTDAFIAVYTYDSGWRHVECDKCYYLGPGEGSIRAAIKAHNARLAKPASNGEAVVERVAIALYFREHHNGTWEMATPKNKEWFRNSARAALSAINEKAGE